MAAHDWVVTLEARARGERLGFLAHDIPLEKQDLEHGGALVPPAAPEPPPAPLLDASSAGVIVLPLENMTKAGLQEHADAAGIAGVDQSVQTKAEMIAVIRSV